MYVSISQGNKCDKSGNVLLRNINRIGCLLVLVKCHVH